MPISEAKARIEIKEVFQSVRDEFVVVSVTGMRSMGVPHKGPMEISVKFNIKDMVFDQKLSL